MRVRERRGSQIVEFALVLPLLLVIMLGMIEFSLILYDKAVITNASREGARVGIVAQDRGEAQRATISAQVVTTSENYCSDHLITFGDPEGALTVLEPAFSGWVFGSTLTVTVTYDYNFLVLPAFVLGLSDPLTLRATTVMNLE